MFGRNKVDTSIWEGRELVAARKALAADPVYRGVRGTVDINSPAGKTNRAVQQRLRAAEAAYQRATS